MAIPSELSPDLIDPSGFDQIITSPYDLAQAKQLLEYGLPVRPTLSHDRRKRQMLADSVMAQNADANAMRYDLANGQLDNDARKMDYDLAAAALPAFAETNEQAMAELAPLQAITNDGGAGLNAILRSGDMVNRSKTLADAAKAQAEAENEGKRADAAMIAAQNSGGEGNGAFELEYNANGDLIGMKQKGKGPLPVGNSGKATPTESVFDEGNNQNAEPMTIPSTKSNKQLIRNSDGSGTLITEDGRRIPVTRDNMAKYGF